LLFFLTEKQGGGKQDIDRHELLYQAAEDHKQRRQALTAQKSVDDQLECTFSPAITKNKKGLNTSLGEGTDVYDTLYMESKVIPSVTSTEDLELSNFCTFSPKISRRLVLPDKMATYPGFDKSVVRLRKAHEARNNSCWDEPREARKGFTKQTPFSFDQRVPVVSATALPLFYLDIKLNPTQSERLPIYEGANPVTLARQFAASEGLDHRVAFVLENLIRQQLRKYYMADGDVSPERN